MTAHSPANAYDDPQFFEAYQNFPRSVKGLSAAGEWHELEQLMPDLTGKRVLDLGCGFGWHCRYAADHGAAQVVGVDSSERMLEKARRDSHSPAITYLQQTIEDSEFAPESFDFVLSSLALHYVEDLGTVLAKVYEWLVPGGHVLISMEHPVFTAEGSEQWVRDSEGKIDHWPVDDYFVEGWRETTFLGSTVRKYHRTLTSDVAAVLKAGFTLESCVEPQPSEELLPSMPEELRRPMMLILSGRK